MFFNFTDQIKNFTDQITPKWEKEQFKYSFAYKIEINIFVSFETRCYNQKSIETAYLIWKYNYLVCKFTKVTHRH